MLSISTVLLLDPGFRLRSQMGVARAVYSRMRDTASGCVFSDRDIVHREPMLALGRIECSYYIITRIAKLTLASYIFVIVLTHAHSRVLHIASPSQKAWGRYTYTDIAGGRNQWVWPLLDQ